MMATPEGRTAAQAVAGEALVLCELHALTLAIPQSDVVSIEHRAELSPAAADESAIGWFDTTSGLWPAYAIDAQLQPLSAARASGSFLVFVFAQPRPMGLLCESVRIVRRRAEIDVQPLPAVMQRDGGVVRGISRMDKARVALVFGEGGVARHLTRIAGGEKGHG
jgi:hypothetical protein